MHCVYLGGYDCNSFNGFYRYGCTKVVISDQGREFLNQVSQLLLTMTKTEHRISSAYHPQTITHPTDPQSPSIHVPSRHPSDPQSPSIHVPSPHPSDPQSPSFHVPSLHPSDPQSPSIHVPSPHPSDPQSPSIHVPSPHPSDPQSPCTNWIPELGLKNDDVVALLEGQWLKDHHRSFWSGDHAIPAGIETSTPAGVR